MGAIYIGLAVGGEGIYARLWNRVEDPQHHFDPGSREGRATMESNGAERQSSVACFLRNLPTRDRVIVLKSRVAAISTATNAFHTAKHATQSPPPIATATTVSPVKVIIPTMYRPGLPCVSLSSTYHAAPKAAKTPSKRAILSISLSRSSAPVGIRSANRAIAVMNAKPPALIMEARYGLASSGESSNIGGVNNEVYHGEGEAHEYYCEFPPQRVSQYMFQFCQHGGSSNWDHTLTLSNMEVLPSSSLPRPTLEWQLHVVMSSQETGIRKWLSNPSFTVPDVSKLPYLPHSHP